MCDTPQGRLLLLVPCCLAVEEEEGGALQGHRGVRSNLTGEEAKLSRGLDL